METLVQNRPALALAEAESLAEAYFGKTGKAKELPSERDQNFLLTTATEDRFVLKVSNAEEADGFLHLQNAALQHVADVVPALVLPRVCHSVDGDDLPFLTTANGVRHGVRLLTFLPGRFLANVSPHSSQLMEELGTFMGRLDQALESFSHPSAERTFHWDLQQGPAVVKEKVHLLQTDEQQALVAHFLQMYDAVVTPREQVLRKQIIHNDANDYNVLAAVTLDFEAHLDGLIDFGDMVYSYTAGEVAVASAYAMMDKENPLEVAAQIVRGYNREMPLHEVELEVLFPMIAMRLCMSVCIGAVQIAANPENEYLRISQRPAWALLEQLRHIHPRFAAYTFRHACDLNPCPDTSSITAWLQAEQANIGPLVPSASLQNPYVFDLSIGSLLMEQPPSGNAMQTATERLFEVMERAGATVGIGRYNEARRFYDSEQFLHTPDGVAEPRTIHLGLDLFAQAGTPVWAPLDAVVHSVANNALPLDYGPTVILEHKTSTGERFYTLYGHLSTETLEHLEAGCVVRKGDIIGWLGAAEVNGGWPPHLHFQIIADLLDNEHNFPGVAAPSQRAVWLSLSPDPNRIAQLPVQLDAGEELGQGHLLARRRQHIGSNLRISYKKHLHIVRGKGAYLYDVEGRAFLDVVNNVCHVGHCHPRVVEAAAKQLAVLNTNTRYLHDNLLTYAERLAAKFPDPLQVCFFVCSGSEANELALRLARAHTGKNDIMVLDVAYHGNTGNMVDLSPYKNEGPGGKGAPPHVHKVAIPDGYRGRYRFGEPDIGAKYAEEVQDVLSQADVQGRGVAAFIAESLPGCGGQIVLADGYLEAAYHHIRAAGGVCIADEVQVGFGRVGSHFWGFELQGVVPDIVTMGKPIGNGHPLGAVITTPEIAASFANGMEYFNTFGGNPVSCAIGLAVLDVIEEEGLQANAYAVGEHLMAGLRDLQERYPLIGHVRGAGLFIGAELVLDAEQRTPAPKHASYIAERMRDHGILISTDGPYHNVLKMKPPIVFTKEQADRLVTTLDRILRETPVQI